MKIVYKLVYIKERKKKQSLTISTRMKSERNKLPKKHLKIKTKFKNIFAKRPPRKGVKGGKRDWEWRKKWQCFNIYIGYIKKRITYKFSGIMFP